MVYLSAVSDHLLFIDIEASGLPKQWDVPYCTEGNWPYAIQVAWVVFDKDGRQIKEEDLYIKDKAIAICDQARRIHRLTHEFLQLNGKSREEVLMRLQNDLQTYQPLQVGHFLELDFHVLSAVYHRIGQENPMLNYPFLCTMLATRHLVQNPAKKYLRLEELYAILFNSSLANQHNAMADAVATAKCYFALMERRQVNPTVDHRNDILLTHRTSKKVGCSLLVLAFFLTVLILWISL